MFCNKDPHNGQLFDEIVHLEGGGRQHLGTGIGILLLLDEREDVALWLLSKEEGGLLLFKVVEEEEEEGGLRLLLPDELDRDCGHLLSLLLWLLLPNM